MTRTCLMRPVKKQDPTYIMVRWTIIFRSNKPYLVLLNTMRMIFAQKLYLILNPSISTIISWFLEWLEFDNTRCLLNQRLYRDESCRNKWNKCVNIVTRNDCTQFGSIPAEI